MAYTPTIWQDGVTPVNAANLNKLENGLAAAVGVPADVVVTPATAHLIRNRYSAGDTQPSFRLLADGKQEWGVGGSTAPDTSLYRDGPASLYTPGFFWAGGSIFSPGAIEGSPLRGFNDLATGIAASFYVGSDAFDRICIKANGKMEFGSGAAAADTFLYRAGASALQVDGNLYVNGSVFWTPAIVDIERAPGSRAIEIYGAADTAASRMNIWGDGKIEWGPGVTAPMDTNLYRYTANILKTDDSFYAAGSVYASQGAAATGFVYNPSAGNLGGAAFYSAAVGDSQASFRINGFGAMSWGPGGATATDTSLYRYAANSLGTDGDLHIGGGLFVGPGGTAITQDSIELYGRAAQTVAYMDFHFYTGTPQDFNVRLMNNGPGILSLSGIGATGAFQFLPDADKINFGTGADTNLYRTSAAVLKTDGSFQAGAELVGFGDVSSQRGTASQIVLSTIGGLPGIYFHNSLDTTLTRPAGGVLKTNGQFWATGDVYAHYGLSTQVRIGNSSSLPSVAFGSSLDTVISRYAAGVVAVNGEPIRRSVCGIISGAGVVQSGGGFSCVRTGTGQYTVTFSTAFGFSPAVVVNAIMNGMIFCTPASINGSNFTVIIRGTGGGVEDRDFAFIASI